MAPAQQALRQVSSAGFESNQSALDAFNDGAALTGAHSLRAIADRRGVHASRFNPVKMLDLAHDPAGRFVAIGSSAS